jgi:hypothetical protein
MYIRDANGVFQSIKTIKGDTGDSGVCLGSEQPTDPKVNVWIKPGGEIANDTFELIQEITFTEATNIWYGREPDGTLYNFKKIRIWLNSPVDVNGFNIQFYNDVNGRVCFQKWTEARTAYEGYPITFFADISYEGGLISARISKAWTDYETDMGDMGNYVKYVGEGTIVAFGLSAAMPAGATMRIWGVRA